MMSIRDHFQAGTRGDSAVTDTTYGHYGSPNKEIECDHGPITISMLRLAEEIEETEKVAKVLEQKLRDLMPELPAKPVPDVGEKLSMPISPMAESINILTEKVNKLKSCLNNLVSSVEL